MKIGILGTILGSVVMLGGVLVASEDRFNQSDEVVSLVRGQRLSNILLHEHIKNNLGRLIINLESLEDPNLEERRELLLYKGRQEDVRAVLEGLYNSKGG